MTVKIRYAIGAAYLAAGVFFAWTHHYLNIPFLRTLGSVVLAVLLWWLVPLGVDLHIH
jgi:hypothetical protein